MVLFSSRGLIKQELLDLKKQAVEAAADGKVSGKPLEKDLLSLIGASLVFTGLDQELTYTVQANMAADLRENQRMTDAEVKAEISTFVSLELYTQTKNSNDRCWQVTTLHQLPSLGLYTYWLIIRRAKNG